MKAKSVIAAAVSTALAISGTLAANADIICAGSWGPRRTTRATATGTRTATLSWNEATLLTSSFVSSVSGAAAAKRKAPKVASVTAPTTSTARPLVNLRCSSHWTTGSSVTARTSDTSTTITMGQTCSQIQTSAAALRTFRMVSHGTSSRTHSGGDGLITCPLFRQFVRALRHFRRYFLRGLAQRLTDRRLIEPTPFVVDAAERRRKIGADAGARVRRLDFERVDDLARLGAHELDMQLDGGCRTPNAATRTERAAKQAAGVRGPVAFRRVGGQHGTDDDDVAVGGGARRGCRRHPAIVRPGSGSVNHPLTKIGRGNSGTMIPEWRSRTASTSCRP